MSQFGTCERGCTEQKLELVPADQYDRLTAFTASARIRADAFRPVAEKLASRRPAADEIETAYRSVQEVARTSLRRYPPLDASEVGIDQSLECTTTWWCAGCGGIDAPQPCLGICIWRRVEWVNATLYEHERQRALAERHTEGRLRRLPQRAASITPREGHWQQGWNALEALGRQALRAP